jgi:hypothetical protein
MASPRPPWRPEPVQMATFCVSFMGRSSLPMVKIF